MPDLADVIDRGVRAFVTGKIPEARAAFLEALAKEPGNLKARDYLARIESTHGRGVPVASTGFARVPRVGLPSPTPVPNSELKPFDVSSPGEATLPEALKGEEGEGEYAPSPWGEGPVSGTTIVLDDSTSGLDLSAISDKSDLRPLVPQHPTDEAGPPTDVELWTRAAKELFALGDFSGSLELIEKILKLDPDHAEARDYLRQNEATLVSMYESKLGPLHAIPRLAIKPEEVMWLNLDHRSGFLLAQIDGSVDYEGLFAVSGLPRLDTARILANLIADGVIRS